MESEIITCHSCGKEIDLHYLNDEVVFQSTCKCNIQKLINGKKPIDYFIEVLNEKSKSIPSKVSKSTKASNKRS